MFPVCQTTPKSAQAHAHTGTRSTGVKRKKKRKKNKAAERGQFLACMYILHILIQSRTDLLNLNTTIKRYVLTDDLSTGA